MLLRQVVVGIDDDAQISDPRRKERRRHEDGHNDDESVTNDEGDISMKHAL